MTLEADELWLMVAALLLTTLGACALFVWRQQKKTLVEALARKTTTETERNRVKGDFLSMVGHEIRTPLNGVVGMTTLLGRTALDEEQRAMLDQIGRSAEHMTRLVDDLLDFAFIEAGRIALQMGAVDVAEIAEDVVDDLAPRARSKRIAIDLHVDVDAPKLARADEARLRRVLRTLVENAIEFTDEGTVLVRVQRAHDPGRVRCVVADTGSGMAAPVLDRLFNAPVSLDAETSRAGPRLGARIARALVEKMGSRLDVSSKLGSGTVFSFELAVEADAQAADPLPVRALIACEDSASSRLLRDHSDRLGLRADVIDRLADLPARIVHAATTNDPYRIGFVQVDAQAAARVATSLLDAAVARLGFGLPALVAVAPPGAERIALESLDWPDDAVMRPLGPRRLEAVTRRCIAVRDERESARPRKSRSSAGAERVLIAEDHETNRLVALGYVRHLGFEGHVVTSGREAIEAVKADHEVIDAILLDAEMPDGNGLEATRAIRLWEAQEGLAEVPIIVVTAHAAKFYEAEALAAGANAYLRKPIRIEQIGRLLYRLFGRKRDRRISQPEPPVPLPKDTPVVQLDPAILDDLRRLVDPSDDRFLRELLESFRTTSERLMSELRQAIDTDDAETIRKHAHQMKGSARTLGATELAETFYALEQAQDAAAREAAYARALVELPETVQAFERFATTPR